MRKLTLFVPAITIALAASSAFAQKAEAPRRAPELVNSDKTFSQFMAAGYEVKAMAGMGGIGFVLQKGSSIAICKMERVPGQRDAVATELCMESVR